MKSIAGYIYTHFPPQISLLLRSLRNFVAPRKLYKQEVSLLKEIGLSDTVIAGPFKGLQYGKHVSAGARLPMLLGTYELELHPAVETICQLQPDLLIDIGCAVGYYANGFATRIPNLRVIAYDISRWGRYLCRKMAKRNGVGERVAVRAECSPTSLQSDLAEAKTPVIVSDCEGFESVILDPILVPNLQKAFVLVELHDNEVPNVSKTIENRFKESHQIEKIGIRPRHATDVDNTISLLPHQVLKAIEERRNALTSWYFMSPKS